MYKVFASVDDVSCYCAQHLLECIQDKPSAALGLATGSSTMEPVYAALVSLMQRTPADLARLTTFNLDEYIGLSPTHPQSYGYYMREHLFGRLAFLPGSTHLPDGTAASVDDACRAYSEAIRARGGLDFQLLGIGTNGHIGFNEPYTPFTSRTHVVELSEQTRQDNGRFFTDQNEVPTRAITLGIQDILEAGEIFLVATGSHKAATVRQLYESDVDEAMPASALKRHGNVTIVLDSAAAALLPNEVVQRAC